MRKTTFILICLSLLMAFAAGAEAKLVFNFDFGQDGIYDHSWPLKSGEEVMVDIYVSNVPDPGLRSMGFKFEYAAASALQVVPSGTQVNAALWPVGYLDSSKPGEIQMAGFHTGTAGYVGNDIKLGSVRFQSKQTGTVLLRLLDRGQNVDEFVLMNGPEPVLDREFPDGIFLTAQIVPPTFGDVNGDGLVNLADAIVSLKVMARTAHGTVHANADINGDDKIGLQEVIYILQRIALLR
jgi:hypothetical protein